MFLVLRHYSGIKFAELISMNVAKLLICFILPICCDQANAYNINSCGASLSPSDNPSRTWQKELFNGIQNPSFSIAEFVASHGRSLTITEEKLKSSNGRPLRQFFIDSIPATRIYDGESNQGIFFFEKDGQARTLKLFDIGNSKERLAESFHELRNGLLAESLNGPTIGSFGITEFNTDFYFFIEMERIFPHESAINSKSLLSVKSLSDPHHDFATAAKIQKISKIAIKLFLESFSEGILPRDPQFLISTSGDMRWIDSGQWQLFSEAENTSREMTEILHSFMVNLYLPMERIHGRMERQKTINIFAAELAEQAKVHPHIGEENRSILLAAAKSWYHE